MPLRAIILPVILVITAIAVAIPLSAQGSAIPDSARAESVRTADQDSKGLFTGRPGKAAMYSLILPGTGQIYNKSYWKLPIVYGAVGGTVGLLVHNTKQHRELQERYRISIETRDPRSNDIRRLRNQARKNQQTSILILGIVWALNSAEAFVDAHLSTFDVDDDLGWYQVEPLIYTSDEQLLQVGIAISF